MQAFSYRGPGDPSEEALYYVVQTAAAKQKSKDQHQIPSLPSGSIITGLAAAAIQHAEVIAVMTAPLIVMTDAVDVLNFPDLSTTCIFITTCCLVSSMSAYVSTLKATSSTVKVTCD